MQIDVILNLLEWAAKSAYAEDLLKYLIAQARAWAKDDGKVNWNDELVDVLEMVANFLYKKYKAV